MDSVQFYLEENHVILGAVDARDFKISTKTLKKFAENVGIPREIDVKAAQNALESSLSGLSQEARDSVSGRGSRMSMDQAQDVSGEGISDAAGEQETETSVTGSQTLFPSEQAGDDVFEKEAVPADEVADPSSDKSGAEENAGDDEAEENVTRDRQATSTPVETGNANLQLALNQVSFLQDRVQYLENRDKAQMEKIQQLSDFGQQSLAELEKNSEVLKSVDDSIRKNLKKTAKLNSASHKVLKEKKSDSISAGDLESVSQIIKIHGLFDDGNKHKH